MMHIMRKFEENYKNNLPHAEEIPEFRAGDTVNVVVKITDGNQEREQSYEGVCLARHNNGLGSTFTVRKISHGVGVERVFMLYSPKIKINLVRKGKVRRAKIYYIRKLSGKKARIKERK